jgi:hypothetical protein
MNDKRETTSENDEYDNGKHLSSKLEIRDKVGIP